MASASLQVKQAPARGLGTQLRTAGPNGPPYHEYQAKTDRQIPVVVLEPTR